MKQKLPNKLWLRVGIIVAIMTTALSGTVWAETVTKAVTLSSGTFQTDHITWTLDDVITITQAKGTSSTAVNSSYISSPRIYQGHVISFEATSGVTITSIVISGPTGTGSNSISKFGTNAGWTINSTDGTATWSGSASSASITAGAQVRPTGITITYTTSGGSSAVATTTAIDHSGITNTDVYVDTAGGYLSASVTASGSAVDGATVTWSGNNNSVATINASTGVVTLVAAGTVTFTANYAGKSGEYLSSSDTYEMTVTSSAPDYVTLPFEWEGGASANLLALDGVTANGLGSDYNEGNAPYLVKLDGTGDYIQIKTDSQPGKVTVGVKMIGGGNTSTITVQESADGETFTNVQALTISGAQNDVLSLETSNAFATTTRYVRLYFTKGSNVGVGPISIAKASTDPAIVAESSVNLADNATSGEIEYSINNSNGNTLTASSSTDWISNITVTATKVTFTTTANTGAERVGTITLSYEGAANKVITVTQAEYVVELTYNLASSITSGKHYIIVNNDSEKAMGGQNSNNRAAVEVTNNNGSVTFLSNAGVAEFIIYGPDADGLYTIYDGTGYLYAASSGSNYLKTQATVDDNARWKITFSNDVASVVATQSSNRNVMQYNSTSALFACYATASQSAVSLYEKDGESTPTETVTVSDADFATYASDNALDFSSSSIKAYVASASGTTGVTFTQVSKVPANTGVLLYYDGGKTESIPTVTGTASDVSGNVFKRGAGAAVTSVDGSYRNYILNQPSEKPIGFYKAAGQTVAKNRAYIHIDESAPIKEFIALPDFEDDATSIQNSKFEIQNEEAPIYNLAGQRLQKMQKGINIVNGKKIMVK